MWFTVGIYQIVDYYCSTLNNACGCVFQTVLPTGHEYQIGQPAVYQLKLKHTQLLSKVNPQGLEY